MSGISYYRNFNLHSASVLLSRVVEFISSFYAKTGPCLEVNPLKSSLYSSDESCLLSQTVGSYSWVGKKIWRTEL